MIISGGFSFAFNPKCASSTLAHAFGRLGYNVTGQRHAMRPQKAPVRGVVVRDDLERLKSGWRAWCKGDTSFEDWCLGDPVEVAEGVDFKRTPQSYWTDGATHFLRFDHLQEDWNAFCEAALIFPVKLLHLNRS